MKPGLKTAAIFTALLAGTAIAGAYPHDQDTPRQKKSKPSCPVCGNPQGQRAHRPIPSMQHRQSGQHPRGAEFQQRQHNGEKAFRKWEPSAEQKATMSDRYAKILAKFDLNGDGNISEIERQIVRKGWEKQQRRNHAKAILQQDEEPVAE